MLIQLKPPRPLHVCSLQAKYGYLFLVLLPLLLPLLLSACPQHDDVGFASSATALFCILSCDSVLIAVFHAPSLCCWVRAYLSVHYYLPEWRQSHWPDQTVCGMHWSWCAQKWFSTTDESTNEWYAEQIFRRRSRCTPWVVDRIDRSLMMSLTGGCADNFSD